MPTRAGVLWGDTPRKGHCVNSDPALKVRSVVLIATQGQPEWTADLALRGSSPHSAPCVGHLPTEPERGEANTLGPHSPVQVTFRVCDYIAIVLPPNVVGLDERAKTTMSSSSSSSSCACT